MLARLNHPSAKAHICVQDADRARKDPTGTFRIRRRLIAELDRRWRRVELAAKAMVLSQDMFGLGANTITSSMVNLFIGNSSQLSVFQTWVDAILNQIVLEGDGQFLQRTINDAYFLAVGRVAKRTKNANLMAQQFVSGHKIETIHRLGVIELQGIIEAVSQQVVRVAGDAIIRRQKPVQLYRSISAVIRKIGVSRGRDLVSILAVRAHSEGTLDAFEAAGVNRVGVIAETVRTRPLKLPRFRDARKTGPGSRSRKKTPSRTTVSRIRRVNRQLEEELPKVDVLTAGDDRVCPICIDIEESGPYTINEARGLIPAHIRCRCAFVDAGFGDAEPIADDYNPNQLRDPKGSSTGGQWTKDPNKPIEKMGLVDLFEKSKELRKALKEVKTQAERDAIMEDLKKVMKRQYDLYKAKGNHNKASEMAYKLKKVGVDVGPVSFPTPAVPVQPLQSVTPLAPSPATPAPVVPNYKFPPYTQEQKEAFAALVNISPSEDAARGLLSTMKQRDPVKRGILNEYEAAFIARYTGNGYKELNAALRKGVLRPQTWEYTRRLNDALDRLEPFNGKVYRKATLNPEQANQYIPGMVIEERGFTSTSKNSSTWSGSYRYIIESKKGRDIQELSHHYSEAEVLFKSGSRFRVIKREGFDIVLEEV